MDQPEIFLYESNMGRGPANGSIVTCNLFGETADLLDGVHCETIAARSRLHDWQIAAHRHQRLHQFLFIEGGRGHARIEDRALAIPPMHILNVPVGDVHACSFARGTRGWVLTVATEVLDQITLPSEGLHRVLSSAQVVRGTAEMRTILKQILAEYAGCRFARAHVLRALTAMLIGLVAREMTTKEKLHDSMTHVELFGRFEELLEQHFLKHWTVSQYAAALSITPTHLSRITRSATGCAASRLIVERIVREARRNLVFTNLPISAIAFALGFNDPAYFTRQFSEVVGLSPRRFREKLSGPSAPNEIAERNLDTVLRHAPGRHGRSQARGKTERVGASLR
jgi:AraC family transcriptional regulator, transcriptional activator of pobA